MSAQQQVRLTIPKAHTTTGGRRGLYIFLFGALILIGGISYLIWPIVDIVVTPKIDHIQRNFSLKLDLDVSTTITQSGIVPVRYLKPGENLSSLESLGLLAITTNKSDTLLVVKKDLESTWQYALDSSLSPNDNIISNNTKINYKPATVMPSGKSFTLPVMIEVDIYRQFPVKYWKEQLVGKTKDQALNWLNLQPGVDKVKINYYPYFFANISQKFPSNPSALRFTLDLIGKTTILEER